jgi:transcription antitermination factor NusG
MSLQYQLYPGDRVKIVDGTFIGRQGRVVERSRYGLVLVELILFGRSVPVDLEPWQIERIPENN